MNIEQIKGVGIPSGHAGVSIIIGVALVVDSEGNAQEQVNSAENLIIVCPGLITPPIVQKFSFVGAFVSSIGGWSSHGVILARAKGIPCLVGIGSSIQKIQTGKVVSINIVQGILSLVP